MKITDEHELIKLGWTDANFWDSVFDSTVIKEPTHLKKMRKQTAIRFSQIFWMKLATINIIYFFVVYFK